MRKSKIKGWQKVFVFALKQTIKSKTFIITTVVSAIMMMIFIPYSMKANDMYSESSNIENMVIINDSDIKNVNHSDILNGYGEKYKKINIIDSDNTLQEEKNSLEENKNDVLLHIYKENEEYNAVLIRNEDGDVKEVDALILSEVVNDALKKAMYRNCGIEDGKIEVLMADVEENIIEVSDISESDDDTGLGKEYYMAFIIYILLVMCGENIGNMLVTEKASKVIEYMLTSIETKALLIGKAAAGVTTSILQIGIMTISGIIVTVVGSKTGLIESDSQTILKQLGLCKISTNAGIISIIAALIIIILGFTFYVMIACFSASLVSRIEEISEASKMYVIIVVFGFLAAVYQSMGLITGSTVEKILCLIPFTSVYLAPSMILNGEIGIKMVCAIIAVMFVCTLIAVRIVTRTYEMLITYNGTRIKGKQILKILFSIKGGKLTNEKQI